MNKESRFDSNYLIDNRQIRIFLSSTFSDMQAERSALVKTFEKLKHEANLRNVSLSVIDLRWGVTEEEAHSGKVISVCLNEIEHSHPFFIGLLGSRYGTSLDSAELIKSPDLKERYPWIEKDFANGLSITEMEIQYGVLRNNANINAAFYIKQCETQDDNPKLTALKRNIRSQKQYPVEDYITIEELCEKVETEVKHILNHLFPEKEVSLLDRERVSQRAYINSRHSHYIKKQEDFDRINSFIQGEESNLVISGLSGIGKSALIANWIKENENRDDVNIVYHFISNTYVQNNNSQILKHIRDEIYDLYKIEKSKSNSNETIAEEVQRILVEAKQKGGKPLLIVIDGINQIDEQNDSKLLNWLPNAENFVKYLFSTIEDDETMNTFTRREYSIYTISALSPTQREKYIKKYLADVGKKLTQNQITRILQCPNSDNMLFLRTLLDELIVFGAHERLDNRIDYYLSATDLDAFFQKVLERMEDDYSLDIEMVQHILSLIAVSEQGLSEDEIVSIANIRQIDWNLFYCAFYNHLINSNGFLDFSHQFISNAVINRYQLNISDRALLYRQEIIQYFENLPINDMARFERMVSELSFQYYQTKDYKKLHSIVIDYNAFNVFNQSKDYTLALYWRALLNDGANYKLSDYLYVPIEPYGVDFVDEKTGHEYIWYPNLPLFQIGEFVHTFFADYETAKLLLEKARSMMTDNNPGLSVYYNDLGTIFHDQGAYKKAIDCFNKALRIQETKNRTSRDVAMTSNLIGLAYYNLGQYNQSLEHYHNSVELYKKIKGDNCFELAKCYNNIAMVYEASDDYPNALSFYQQALSISTSYIGENTLFTSTILNNVGELYMHIGKYDQAKPLFEKSYRILVSILGKDHPHTLIPRGNIGGLLFHMGKYNEALEYHLEGLHIMETSNRDSRPTLGIYYLNIGSVYNSLGDYKNALDYYNRSLEIKRTILPKEHEDFALLYSNIGSIYAGLHEYEKALGYYEQALSLYKKLFGDNNSNVALVYNNISEIYIEKGLYEKAIELQNKAIEIKKFIYGESYPSLAINYNSLGCLYSEIGNHEMAIKYYHKACSVFIGCYGEHYPDLAICYHNIGDLLKDKEDYYNALEYYLKALLIEMNTYGTEGSMHPRIEASIVKILITKNKVTDLSEKVESMDPELRWLLGTMSVFSKS